MKKHLQAVYNIAVWIACALAVALYPFRLVRKLFARRVVSLWVGTPIITMATNSRAERLLGVNAKSLVFTTFYITDAFDYNLSRFTAIPLLGRLVPLLVFVWACITVGRLHFYCSRGRLPSRGAFTFDFRELYVYRWVGIDVFLGAYGADVRNQQTARAMGYPNPCTDCDAPG